MTAAVIFGTAARRPAVGARAGCGPGTSRSCGASSPGSASQRAGGGTGLQSGAAAVSPAGAGSGCWRFRRRHVHGWWTRATAGKVGVALLRVLPVAGTHRDGDQGPGRAAVPGCLDQDQGAERRAGAGVSWSADVPLAFSSAAVSAPSPPL